MKKVICLFFIVSFFAVSFSKAPKQTTIIGNIILIENDPVAKYCIISNGKEYGISAANEILMEIKGNNHISVTGDLILPQKNVKSPFGGKDGTIILESWSVVE